MRKILFGLTVALSVLCGNSAQAMPIPTGHMVYVASEGLCVDNSGLRTLICTAGKRIARTAGFYHTNTVKVEYSWVTAQPERLSFTSKVTVPSTYKSVKSVSVKWRNRAVYQRWTRAGSFLNVTTASFKPTQYDVNRDYDGVYTVTVVYNLKNGKTVTTTSAVVFDYVMPLD